MRTINGVTQRDSDFILPKRQAFKDDWRMNSRINHVAVVASAIVQWIIGGAWYAAFGNVWLNLHAKTMTDIENPNAVLPYVMAFVAALFVSYGLAWVIARQNAKGVGSGLAIGVICWFCF